MNLNTPASDRHADVAAQGQDERTMTFGVEVGGEKIGEVTLPIAQAVALGFRPQVSDQWLLAVMRRV